jgi:hypothetical protein
MENENVTPGETPEKEQTVAEMEKEMKRLALIAARLEVEEKKANLQDLRERLDERELKREGRRQKSITNGLVLKDTASREAAQQSRCSHKKGGQGFEALARGGTDSQYAVIKHTFHNGDTWVRCLRCGKTWKPPLKATFKSEEAYQAAVADYKAAVQFDTRNIPSGGVRFGYTDGGQYAREQMANATLR